MKKWEDIIKEKVEEPDGALPESVFDEFRARRSTAAPIMSQKSIPMWLIAAAAAAILAAVLFINRPADTNNSSGMGLQPSVPVAETTTPQAADSPLTGETLPPTPLIAQALKPTATGGAHGKTQDAAAAHNKKGAEPVGTDALVYQETQDKQSPTDKQESSADQKTSDKQDIIEYTQVPYSSYYPYTPKEAESKPAALGIASTTGIIAGGGVLGVSAVSMLGFGSEPSGPDNPPQYGTTYPLAGEYSHSIPFKWGLSAGIPVAERWKVTTGLEYSLYQSRVTYPIFGEKRQNVHYLGVLLRMDRTLASNRWLDIYIGGGAEGDFCLAATLDGRAIKKDCFRFSLLGAGGIQFNFTRRLGLYAEPQLSWTIPDECSVLKTYRSQHPFMFSAGAGLRLNL